MSRISTHQSDTYMDDVALSMFVRCHQSHLESTA